MSKYTTTIRNLIDNNFDFGLKDYPIFDENYRSVLNNKILNHYYMQEIGFETAGLFKFYLNNKMNEIMDYYNTLYKYQKDLLDKLIYNTNITETLKRDNTTDTTSSTNNNSNYNGTSKYKGVGVDTPMGNIQGQDIDNYDHASSEDFNKKETNNIINDSSNSTGKATNLENYVKTITGFNGKLYGVEILEKIKKNFINIDMLIIKDLQELFMGIM